MHKSTHKSLEIYDFYVPQNKNLLNLCNLREKKYPQTYVEFVRSMGNLKERSVYLYNVFFTTIYFTL